MLSVNTYRHTFVATCPSDGDQIVYQLELTTSGMILVEHIRTATALIREGFQEQIADQLHQRFSCDLRLIGTHQGVEIESLRRPA